MATLAQLQAARAAAVAAVDRPAVKILDEEIARVTALLDQVTRDMTRRAELDSVLAQYGG